MTSKNLPFELDTIYETIVTTADNKKNQNAAPMGIKIDRQNNVKITAYNTSDTCENLWKNELGAINLTLNPKLFTLSALFQEDLKEEYFVRDNQFDIPILKECKDSYLIVKVAQKEKLEGGLTSLFICTIEKIQLSKKCMPIFTRAFSLLIEILIDATRIVAFSQMKYPKTQILVLEENINRNIQVIKRITPQDSHYRILITKILSEITAKKQSM